MMACRKLPAPLLALLVTTGLVRQLTTVERLVPESFSEFGSLTLFTVAWFVYSTPRAPAGTWPTKVNTLVVLGGKLAIVQLVVAAGMPQSQAGPEFWVKNTKVRGNPLGTPPGNVSVKLGLVAASGPRFVTVIVKTRSVLGKT